MRMTVESESIGMTVDSEAVGMTVEDMIEKLKEYPKDLLVVMPTGTDFMSVPVTDVWQVSTDVVKLS